MGHKQIFAVQKVMSALPPKADIARLFDHLVGEREYELWNGQPDSFCGLQIQREPILCWLFKWQVSWLRPLKYTIHHCGGAFDGLFQIRSVRHQSSVANQETVLVHRGQTPLRWQSQRCACGLVP